MGESDEFGQVDKRLKNMENALETITGRSLGVRNTQELDVLDLLELWNVIWAGKLKILLLVSLVAVLSIVYSLSIPDVYKSNIVLAPASEESKGGLGGLVSQYGGLAAMAGINLGGGSRQIYQALELAESWPFLEGFIKKYDIKPMLLASAGWNPKTGKLIYDQDKYDPESGKWVRDVEDGGDAEPTSWQSYKALLSMLSLSYEEDAGLFRISVQHHSPIVARQWAQLLTKEINSYFQQRDVRSATTNIEFLKSKIRETSVTELHMVLYSLIEQQTKTLMLAEESDEYILKTLVPAMVPEEKSEPQRALIVVFSTLVAGIVGIAYVLISYYLKKSDE